MMNTRDKNKSWLSYVNLSDAYERKARFVPGLLAIMFCLPAAIAFGVPLTQWLAVLAAGVGFSVVISIGISHCASAMGNDLQQKLWPRWPHDSPTHAWLHPGNEMRSDQQRQRWYGAVQTLTGLDLASVPSDDPQLEPLVNDAVSELKAKLWKLPLAKRVDMHNADFGFARNFTGLRPIWLTISVASALACWIAPFVVETSFAWPIMATAMAVLAFFLAFRILPNYVRVRADYYAESFFAAVLELSAEARAPKDSRDVTDEPRVADK